MSARCLSPLRSKHPPKARKFGVYDFEWWPNTYEFRLAGYLDENGYRSFLTVEKFLNFCLRPKMANRLLFAHWGGIADILFLIRPLYERGLKLENFSTRLVMNGSAAAIVTAKQPRVDAETGELGNDRRWIFVDSSFLFRVSLAEIGEWRGQKKGGDTGLSWKSESMKELVEYNQQDCVILYDAIEEFQTIVNKMGAKMGLTTSSTAMDLFRRKYLTAPIITPGETNDFAFTAYYASRVEVYRPYMAHGCSADINSSFVYSMTHVLPGSPIKDTYGEGQDGWGNTLPPEGTLYIAECRVRVPGGDYENNPAHYLPPLPYRDPQSHRIFFPTGEWIAAFTSVDLDLARSMGTEILDVRRVTTFQPCHDFAAFANDVYNQRMAAGSKFLKITIKLVGNGCYGKLSEGEEKCEFVMHPDSTWCSDHFVWDDEGLVCSAHDERDCAECLDACDCVSVYSPGIIRKVVRREIQHRHVATGAFIVSIARRTLYYGQLKYWRHLHYSDTDSRYQSIPNRPEDIGNALGEWKDEGTCSEMLFVAPKVYGGKDQYGDPILHAKGFPLGKKTWHPPMAESTRIYPPEVVARYQAIINKEPVHNTRMARPKEFLHCAVPLPYDNELYKSLQLRDRPKRPTYDYDGNPLDNNTRPWTAEELAIPWIGERERSVAA